MCTFIFSVFQDLVMTPGQFVKNIAKYRKFVRQMDVKDFLTPVLKDSWSKPYSLPSIINKVNAAYVKETNTISVPTAIIQPPFFWSNPKSLAFGSLGFIAGMKTENYF